MKIGQNKEFLKFPLAVGSDGLQVASRAEHIRDQIEQLLFTGANERVLRPEYGAGAKKLVFEPIDSYLCRITQKRIQAGLMELLQGEAAPESISVEVTAEDEKLFIDIRYTLAAIDLDQNHTFPAQWSDTMSSADPAAKQWDFSQNASPRTVEPKLKLDFVQDNHGNWSARRRVENLPGDLPDCPDDFDWKQRDWDSFRFAMLSDLKRAFPQRTQWSVSDLETVLVEILGFGLDMLSDKADRIMNESFLETACDADRIKLFTDFIGYNPYTRLDPGITDVAGYWRRNPHAMNLARRYAPMGIISQARMVTPEDYTQCLTRHPLVEQCLVSLSWDGSTQVITTAFILSGGLKLDTILDGQHISDDLKHSIQAFHKALDFSEQRSGIYWMPDMNEGVTARMMLERYVNLYRMAGQKVRLMAAREVGIDIRLHVTIQPNFYCSEVMYEVKRIMNDEPGGFFEPGRLGFGEDVTIGDIMEWVMSVDGVGNVRIDQLKRTGNWPDLTAGGVVSLKNDEYAVIRNSLGTAPVGTLSLTFSGGIKG